MPIFTGYAGWIAGVRDFLDADDYSDSKIATFLNLATYRLNRELEAPELEVTNDIPLAYPDYDYLYALPTNFNKVIQVLDYADKQYNAATKADVLRIKAENNKDMKLYAIYGMELYAWPPPSVTPSVITLDYYSFQPTLSPGIPSNYYTDFYADLYLYAACLEAAPYMIEDDRMAVWQAKYDSTLEAYTQGSKRIKLGSTPLLRKF